MKEKNTPKQNNSNKLSLVTLNLLVFILYPLLSILLLNKGMISELLLLVVSIVTLTIMLCSIGMFVLDLGSIVNPKKADYEKLLPSYLFFAFFPLLYLKMLTYVFLKLLPYNHTGILCDIKDFVLDLYKIFRPQQALSLLIWGSLIYISIFVGLVALKRISK